jgi:mono/diheme cytochrome c family protein
MRSLSRFALALASTSLLLAACGGGGDAPADDAAPPSTDATAAADGPEAVLALGKTKYEQVCITCHMADGNGTPGVFPSLVGSEWALSTEVNVPISIVLHGLQGPISVKGETYDAVMQPWGMIPDADIAAILTYVRASWGNNASAVTPAQVAAVREAEGARAAWTADELKTKYPNM